MKSEDTRATALAEKVAASAAAKRTATRSANFLRRRATAGSGKLVTCRLRTEERGRNEEEPPPAAEAGEGEEVYRGKSGDSLQPCTEHRDGLEGLGLCED